MTTFRTLIIDDEMPARIRLRSLLAPHHQIFNIIGEAENGEDALNQIKVLKPDLIFLDIQMPDMNGFELLRKLTTYPLVIFCTAYDEYALQAFETNSIDYLLKPVKPSRIEQTISKLRQWQTAINPELLNKLIQQFETKQNTKATSITIRKGDRMTFIRLDKIVYFMASDKYVSLYSQKGDENITDQTLKDLDQSLPDNFIRIHRSYIVNTNLVKEVQKYLSNRFIFKLEDYSQTKITSGRSYYETIKAWMKI